MTYMKKKGGIFLTGLIILVILIVGLFWFIKNMNVDTDVNVDFSRKETVVNQTGTIASLKCLEDGYKVELRITEEGNMYGVCINTQDKECDEWKYYDGTCTLDIPTESNITETVET